MASTDNLDELIKEYSASLMKVYQKREVGTEEKAVPVFAVKKEEEAEEMPAEENAEPPVTEEIPTDTATFMAAVSTGGGAFPVPNAKIVIRKDNDIVAFLVTDENGETQKITLPAFPRKDSLSADTAKTVNYYADVIAEGFGEKRNLPVEASGGAEIILNAELTPSEERME